MAFLPPEPLTLNGGCFCSAVRYKVSIPALEERPLAPKAIIPYPIPKSPTCSPAKGSEAAREDVKTVPTRFPLIGFDHCESCRRACGAPVQSWLICELKWVEFLLLPRSAEIGATGPVSGDLKKSMQKYATKEVVKPSKKLQEETYIGHYSSNNESERCFCARCGTPMTFHYSGDRGPEWELDALVDIALGTLDQESFEREGVRPERHGWWDDGTQWVKDIVYKGTGPLVRHPTGRLATVVDEDKVLLEH